MATIKLIGKLVIRFVLIGSVFLTAFAPVSASARTKDISATKHSVKLGQPVMGGGVLKSAITNVHTQEQPPQIEHPTETPIIITLEAIPQTLQFDGKVEIHWLIEGLTEKELVGMTLTILLPNGFRVDEKTEGVFDPQRNLLTIPLTSSSGSVQTAAESKIEQDVYFSCHTPGRKGKPARNCQPHRPISQTFPIDKPGQ
jgi:hypothetical protein